MSRLRAFHAQTHIVAWTLACILPMLAGALFATSRLADSERDAERTQLLQTAHAQSAAVDLKLQNSLAALAALATSPALAQTDLAKFYDQCVEIARQHNAWILLVDTSGQQLLNTEKPFGAPLPVLGSSQRSMRVFEDRNQRISGVFQGLRSQALQVSTYVPVFRGAATRFVLIMSFRIEEIRTVLAEQSPPDTWTVAVADRDGLIVARNRALDRFAGQSLGAILRARMKTSNEGTYIGMNQEGTRVFAAFATSRVSGWSVVVGIPVAEVNAPLAKSLWTTGVVTLVMLLIGVVVAAFKGRQITRSLHDLANAALAVANGIPPRPAASPIAEVNEVAASLQAAAARIEQSRARLEQHAAELNDARIEAEHARKSADAANAAKSLFLANMSHELRTPLNAIIGFSEIMRDALFGPLQARYHGYAQDIHASGTYLLRLINDVLDHSKIEVGRLELEEEPVDLADLVDECLRLLQDKASQGAVTVATTVPRELPCAFADRRRLKQVLLNLLSNAIKFTPAGGHVSVSAATVPEGGVAISVIDTGIGMRAEDIPLALQPFQQLDSALTRRYEGTGLGLPLARALTELHGGTCTIASEPGKGTAATVWLPPSRLRENRRGRAPEG